MGYFGKKEDKPKKTKEDIQKEKEDALRDKEEEKKAIEEKQIELAYRFLIQPDVQKATDTQKRNFLRKKGLSHDQIDKAFLRRDQKKEEKVVPKSQEVTIAKQPEKVENNAEVTSTDTPAIVDKQQAEGKQQVAVVEESIETKMERAFKNGFLNLKSSNITEINPKIFEITILKTLVLSQNPLTIIPQQIENLTNLRILQLQECGLTDDKICSQLFSLTSLVELNLSKNKLHDIHLIVNLTSLARLDVSDNDIVELPDDIGKCNKLQLLNLKNNHISFFPLDFVNLNNLKKIVLSGNSFDNEIVTSLQNDGIQGLFKYISSH